MNNGEEAGEIFSDFASPDPLDEWRGDQGLDSGNASSPVSTENSFYDESEFERYCSANSVMGTASICSSSLGTCNDFLDSDLGSFKSFKFDDFGSGGISRRNSGGDTSVRNWVPNATAVSGVSGEEDRLKLVLGNENLVNLKEFSGEGNMLNLGSESHSLKMVVCEDNGSEHVQGDVGSSHRVHSVSRDLFGGSETGSVIEEEEGNNEDNMLNLGSESHSLLGSSNALLKMVVCEVNGSEHVQDDVGSSHRLHLVSKDLFGGSETGSVIEEEEEDGRSSNCEHSDDEGSMYGIGTDDEENVELDHRRNLQFHQVPETEIGNPLFMNSAVTFGADDWNDFEQENEGNGLVSTMWIRPQEQQQQQQLPASLAHAVGPTLVALEEEENVRDVLAASSQVHGIDDSTKDPKSVTMDNILTMKDPLMLQTPRNKYLNIMDGVAERELQGVGNEENLGLDGTGFSSSENSILHLDPLSDVTVSKVCSSSTEGLRGKDKSFDKSNELPPVIGENQEIGVKRIEKDSPVSASPMNNHVATIEVENSEVNDSFDEFVLEMEEILLDSKESHGARFPQGNRASLLQLPHPFRDGSSTASTSGTDDVYPSIQHQLKINGIEVIGAKQIQGDVSFGERLVGVKEYTVYKLRVWSASDQWEVERRYRDFFALYSQLKRLFAAHGWSLPSPWSRVEQESRKIFGNASPGVVSDRSALIQECLRSILHSDSLYSIPTSLICFLSPQKSVSGSFTISEPVPPSPSEFNQGRCRENISSLGQTISLVVEIHPRKSLKQLLEAQHYTCAGCHTHLDAEKTLMQEFVQTFGWGNPRVCDYTGQLFCASCHTNDIAVLPARVLHLWDFTQYPVSQFAKSYLDATYDQPMLCVSAVNPFLFSKVPTLLHVMGIRKKIGAMLPYVRCPFRRSVNKGLGSRRYLLESNDFFALRDLVDLSKGAFAVLPVKLETVSMRILEHITQQCLVCCDAGVPCGARQACEDTSSLIFPFQESEIDRCTSCDLVYHKPCFKKLTGCLCGGTSLEGAKIAHKAAQLKWKSKTEVNESLDVSARPPNSETTVGFLSSLFTRSRPGKTWGSRKSSPVILMGSLPSNSL